MCGLTDASGETITLSKEDQLRCIEGRTRLLLETRKIEDALFRTQDSEDGVNLCELCEQDIRHFLNSRPDTRTPPGESALYDPLGAFSIPNTRWFDRCCRDLCENCIDHYKTRHREMRQDLLDRVGEVLSYTVSDLSLRSSELALTSLERDRKRKRGTEISLDCDSPCVIERSTHCGISMIQRASASQSCLNGVLVVGGSIAAECGCDTYRNIDADKESLSLKEHWQHHIARYRAKHKSRLRQQNDSENSP